MRVKYVISNFPNSQLVAILWHQGEMDVGNTEYKKDLDTFIKDIREELDCVNTSFILGGMVPYWVNQTQGRKDQQHIISDTPNRIQGTGYADPNLPFIIEKVNNDEDAVHYNAEGMREIGRRYFSEFEKLIQ